MTLDELKDGLDQAGIDYQVLVTTSLAADAATFITIHCTVSMADGDAPLLLRPDRPQRQKPVRLLIPKGSWT